MPHPAPARPQPALQLHLPARPRPTSTSSISSTGSKFREHLDAVPITPPTQQDRSHFSPATPRLEAGFGNEKARPPSLRERVGHALSWSAPEQYTPRSPAARGRGRVLPALLALALLFLFANVVFLDVRLATMPRAVEAAAPRGSNAAAAAPVTTPHSPTPANPPHSATPANPAPSATPANLAPSSGTPAPAPAPGNFAALSPAASSCLAQPLPPADPTAFCAQCAPALASISPTWFANQAQAAQAGLARLNAVQTAAQFCTDADAARQGSPG